MVDLLGRYSNQETLHRSLTRALDPQRRGQAAPRVSTRKRQQTKLTDDAIDLLIVSYQDGLSLEDLASAFSIDRRTAGNHLKRRGIPTRGRKLTDEQVGEAAELYRAGWSLGQLGKRYGVYPQSIGYRLKRAGVQLRARSGWDTDS